MPILELVDSDSKPDSSVGTVQTSEHSRRIKSLRLSELMIRILPFLLSRSIRTEASAFHWKDFSAFLFIDLFNCCFCTVGFSFFVVAAEPLLSTWSTCDVRGCFLLKSVYTATVPTGLVSLWFQHILKAFITRRRESGTDADGIQSASVFLCILVFNNSSCFTQLLI